MNFTKLPREKRTQLLAVALLTVVAMGGLGFGLIQWQYRTLRDIADKTEVAEKRLKQVQNAIPRAVEIESDFNVKRKLLAEQEEAMAPGDAYSWVVSLLRRGVVSLVRRQVINLTVFCI